MIIVNISAQSQERLTGSTKYQGIDIYLCDIIFFSIVNVTSQSPTNYQVIPSAGWAFC